MALTKVFIKNNWTIFAKHFRAPEGAPLKSKMIYASSKDAIKKKFTGEICLFDFA